MSLGDYISRIVSRAENILDDSEEDEVQPQVGDSVQELPMINEVDPPNTERRPTATLSDLLRATREEVTSNRLGEANRQQALARAPGIGGAIGGGLLAGAGLGALGAGLMPDVSDAGGLVSQGMDHTFLVASQAIHNQIHDAGRVTPTVGPIFKDKIVAAFKGFDLRLLDTEVIDYIVELFKYIYDKANPHYDSSQLQEPGLPLRLRQSLHAYDQAKLLKARLETMVSTITSSNLFQQALYSRSLTLLLKNNLINLKKKLEDESSREDKEDVCIVL